MAEALDVLKIYTIHLRGIAEQSGQEEHGGPFTYNTFTWKEAKWRRKQHVVLQKERSRHKESSRSRHLTDLRSPSTVKDCKFELKPLKISSATHLHWMAIDDKFVTMCSLRMDHGCNHNLRNGRNCYFCGQWRLQVPVALVTTKLLQWLYGI